MPTIDPVAPVTRAERKRQILGAGSLDAVLDRPGGLVLLQAEADDDHPLITQEGVDHLLAVRAYRRQHGVKLGFFFSTDDVILVPGFLGSTLSDVKGPHGLIWLDPTLVYDSGQLSALKLAPGSKNDSDFLAEQDADDAVSIRPGGSVPIVYDLMAIDLEVRRYSVQKFGFDWRKNIDVEAERLVALIRGRLGQKARPLHIIAHSQGSLVARRAIQLLGPDDARRLVNNLILLGPASFGTFAAAFAIAGSHETIETVQNLGIQLPPDLQETFQSFTGLYQLLPWKFGTVLDGFDAAELAAPGFWQVPTDPARLAFGFKWAERIDASFFNDRTTIVLGDRETVGAVRFVDKKLVPDGSSIPGDGTVPEKCALLPDVRAYKAPNAEHMMLPATLSVMAAVRAILRGAAPAVDRVAFAASEAKGGPMLLKAPPPPRPSAAAGGPIRPSAPPSPPPAPCTRKLRVFSFDPLLATNLDTLGIARITLDVPWEADDTLAPGPVGEYVEVVDFDPASDCFYRPVDLNHPRLLAQDGLPPAEANPQFHQQMTYAVAMCTIETFEKALGRRALWAPRLERDEEGSVIPTSIDEQFIPRLRIYPHALREANAYYDPARHALLFGYFPSRENTGGETLPGGTVFACQSFDIVAHETTHALLHGLHRYFLEASNPDLFAFHEAFADAVALFQHFSHVEVVREQVARSRGDLRAGSQLGRLAQQFGRATGHRGALRDYLGKTNDDGQWVPCKPDSTLLAKTDEPHDRGAVLMAALFQAFVNIYDHRAKDLFRIASGGTGVLPAGDVLPDLVGRLSVEAAKAAKHLLGMCIRALDFVPPVDLTFGEYLRALITADYDLVRDDDRGYRVAVIDAFRLWGIYPPDVNVLDETALRWRPAPGDVESLRKLIRVLPYTDWNLRADRRAVFAKMHENGFRFRDWLYKNARALQDGGASYGLFIWGKGYHSIPRNKRNSPKFEIHSMRPCCRVGPDGQQRVDLVAEVVQRRAGYLDPKIQSEVDAGPPHEKGQPVQYWAFTKKEAEMPNRKLAPKPDFWFRGGCTLIIDPESGAVRYCIAKSITNDNRVARQCNFEQTGALPSLAATYFGTSGRNPFAMLHADDE